MRSLRRSQLDRLELGWSIESGTRSNVADIAGKCPEFRRSGERVDSRLGELILPEPRPSGRRAKVAGWTFALLTLLAAWAANAEEAEPLPLPGRDWPWTAVGRVLIDGDGPCSGVLIEPRLVLTVGHCADGGRPERLTFALETAEHAVAAVRRAPSSPRADTIEDLRHDWALLELEEPANVTPIPYGGPSAARRAFVLDEPLVKVGWVSRGGEYRRARDFVCRIQDLGPEATVFVYRCPGGPGAGRSGSALILPMDQDYEVVAVQSAIATGAPLTFGIAVAPVIDAPLESPANEP